MEYHNFPQQLALEMGENFATYKDNPEMWTRRYVGDEYEMHVIKATEIMTGLQSWKSFVEGTDWSEIIG